MGAIKIDIQGSACVMSSESQRETLSSLNTATLDPVSASHQNLWEFTQNQVTRNAMTVSCRIPPLITADRFDIF